MMGVPHICMHTGTRALQVHSGPANVVSTRHIGEGSATTEEYSYNGDILTWALCAMF